MNIFLNYKKCSTCVNAKKWLEKENICQDNSHEANERAEKQDEIGGITNHRMAEHRLYILFGCGGHSVIEHTDFKTNLTVDWV